MLLFTLFIHTAVQLYYNFVDIACIMNTYPVLPHHGVVLSLYLDNLLDKLSTGSAASIMSLHYPV